MSLTLITPPAAEPINLADMKAHLRVTHSDEDALITGLIIAAVRAIEARCGIAMMAQQWRLRLDEMPRCLILPIGPVSVIDAISVTDMAGTDHSIGAGGYAFAPGKPGRLRADTPWPQAALGGITIDFTAGFDGAIPAPLLQAVKMLCGAFYEQRESTSEIRRYAIPESFNALIAPHREMRL